jgi:ComF family protein
MSKLINYILNILFPTECLSCGTPGPDICDGCIDHILPPKEQNYPWITSLGNYHDEIVRKIMWHIKKQPNGRAAVILAKAFGEMIKNRPEDPTSWILIPIPISHQRFRERGYNQAELLATSLSKIFNLKTLPILIKSRHTNKQGTSKSREERMYNITGSFGIYKKSQALIAGKNCILIDDITTTGSTLIEARDTLLRAGANKVLAWTIAN